MEKEKTQGFDDIAKEALELLFEQFWIIREEEPDKYQMVREREAVLRPYLLEKFGYRLIIHRYFVKLEKIPIVPESWMGIEQFLIPRDYALFCCLLAYLEGKSIDEQFLLSDLTEELQSLYPNTTRLDWTHYEHRKSLVRVLLFAQSQGIVRVVDGDVERFSLMDESEVLYEVPIMSRYFMRSYPKDLFLYDSTDAILNAEWLDGEEEQMGNRRRNRVYRQLFLSPALYANGAQDADFLYLRNYRNRIQEDIEQHSDYHFELYKNTALLTRSERKGRLTLFPDQRAITDIVMQFATVVREECENEDIPFQYDGSLLLTWVDYERWVGITASRFRAGWSKQYRESTLTEVARELFIELVDWKMAKREVETGTILLLPLLGRLSGKYPRDFKPDEIEEVDVHGEE